MGRRIDKPGDVVDPCHPQGTAPDNSRETPQEVKRPKHGNNMPTIRLLDKLVEGLII